MHIDSASTTRNGKTYTRHLLRETYRENGKVRHRTLLNLKNCTEEEIVAMKLALQKKNKISTLVNAALGVDIQQGLSVGALLILEHVAQLTGITRALGNTREGKLALFQVFARTINQGSRLSAIRLCASHDVKNVLGLSDFNEADLYENLDWITLHQDEIENSLYWDRHDQGKTELFLYDVSSSYLEGEANELAEFGYNRDKKKGKRQIILGLLCDQEGVPVSIQVFCGNTNDTKTFKDQANKIANRFGGGSVTLVGDGGMIKAPQIDDLEEFGFHYITSIGKKEINTLVSNGVLQLSLFDNELCEITRKDEGLRYILRRNPQRMLEIRDTRADKIEKLSVWVDEANLYLVEHPKAKIDKLLIKLSKKIKALKIECFTHGLIEHNKLVLCIDSIKKQKCAELDGCYVIKTDLPAESIDKEMIHARYKALAQVEHAFRTFKTGHLELRPVYVRKESRTRGHALVVMLAYRLTQELAKMWSALNLTVEEGIQILCQFCTVQITLGGKNIGTQLQKPNVQTQSLFQAAGFELPMKWGAKSETQNKGVSTKTKLQKRRKNR